MEVFDDFLGDHVRIGEVGRILQALVLERAITDETELKVNDESQGSLRTVLPMQRVQHMTARLCVRRWLAESDPQRAAVFLQTLRELYCVNIYRPTKLAKLKRREGQQLPD